MTHRARIARGVAGALGIALLAACGRGGETTARGAGASLSAPLVARWAEAYRGPGRVDYRATGSGGAVKLLGIGAIDFGVRDVPLSAQELERTGGAYAEIPVAHGTATLAVNLPAVAELRLARSTLAALFMGDLEAWDDPAIAHDNPSISLPHLPILPVHRTDASGMAKRVSAYVAKANVRFAEEVGSGETPNFPTGVRAKGQEGVALAVKSTRGSIGVLELGLARSSGLAVVWLQDDSGTFVPPTPPDGFGASPYPLVTTVYALVPRAPSAHRATTIAFFSWALDEGQALTRGDGSSSNAFGPLSTAERAHALAELHAIAGAP